MDLLNISIDWLICRYRGSRCLCLQDNEGTFIGQMPLFIGQV